MRGLCAKEENPPRRRSSAVRALVVVGAAVSAASCATSSVEPGDGAAAERPLPAGHGRAILRRACTGCHDLEGLWVYQGYYDAPRWRGLVETMIAHGADLNETETIELVEYLVEHFGPGTRRSN
ncbi:MAG: hypothetical protein JXB36_11450 [Gammaproteobacteria bacterium]|nr:hypothetical protein [Gammaproteobacteria bacterium]